MANLTSSERARLPASEFALPGRRYPIDTPGRARNALARGSRFATESERATICRKVDARYPQIHAKSCPVPGHVRRAERMA